MSPHLQQQKHDDRQQSGGSLPQRESIEVTTISVSDLLKKNKGLWTGVVDDVKTLLQTALKEFSPSGDTGLKVTRGSTGVAFTIPNPVSGGSAQGELTEKGSIKFVTHRDGSKLLIIDYASNVKAADNRTDLFPNRDVFFITPSRQAGYVGNVVKFETQSAVPFHFAKTAAEYEELDRSKWRNSVEIKIGDDLWTVPESDGFPVGTDPKIAYLQSLSLVVSDLKQKTAVHYAGSLAGSKLHTVALDPVMRDLLIRVARGEKLP